MWSYTAKTRQSVTQGQSRQSQAREPKNERNAITQVTEEIRPSAFNRVVQANQRTYMERLSEQPELAQKRNHELSRVQKPQVVKPENRIVPLEEQIQLQLDLDRNKRRSEPPVQVTLSDGNTGYMIPAFVIVPITTNEHGEVVRATHRTLPEK